MNIFDPNDPLVIAGVYDIEGYKPGERARIDKARATTERIALMAKKAKDQDLPGMEDRSIKALEEVAEQYADIRDRRMALLQEEIELKAKAMKLMKKHGKNEYRRDGIEILIVPGEESIKVKIKKASDDEDEQAADSGEEAQA